MLTGKDLDRTIQRIKPDDPDPCPYPVMYVTVDWVREKFIEELVAGKMVRRSAGWFVLFHGSFESLRWGDTQPADVKPGDRFRIIFERIDGAAA